MRKSTSCLYAILGVSPTATRAEIKSQYYRLCKLHHPDLIEDSTSKNEGDFVQINQAYTILSDPDTRAAYDRERGETTRPKYFWRPPQSSTQRSSAHRSSFESSSAQSESSQRLHHQMPFDPRTRLRWMRWTDQMHYRHQMAAKAAEDADPSPNTNTTTTSSSSNQPHHHRHLNKQRIGALLFGCIFYYFFLR